LAPCPYPFAKIFRFPFDPNHLHIFRRLVPHKGRIAIVTDAGRDAVDVSGATDESVTLRTAKSCGLDASMVGVKSRSGDVGPIGPTRRYLRGDGDNKARSPGRARRKPLKPSRAGMPGDPGATVVTNARAYYSTRAAAGATGTRHSPLPFGGESFLHNSGALRRGNAELCLRAPDAAQRAALAAWCAADPGPMIEPRRAHGSRLCGAS
jgi:hypothetical protein